MKSFLLLGIAAEYRSQWWASDDHQRFMTMTLTGKLKFTATEMISHSSDMVGAHQNLNGSRDLTMPLSGMVCHTWASTNRQHT